MKQQTEQDVIAEVRRHTVWNRSAIEASGFAGCVSCCTRFPVKEIRDWRDEWTAPEKHNRVKRWSALCPNCGQASVIGSSTGLLADEGYEPIVNAILRRSSTG